MVNKKRVSLQEFAILDLSNRKKKAYKDILLRWMSLHICIRALFSCEIFLNFSTVALSFLFDKHCSTIE